MPCSVASINTKENNTDPRGPYVGNLSMAASMRMHRTHASVAERAEKTPDARGEMLANRSKNKGKLKVGPTD